MQFDKETQTRILRVASDRHQGLDIEELDEQPELPSAETINKAQRDGSIVRSHDAINRSICIESRAKREGVYGYCENCDGDGSVYVEDEARVRLQLWVLHPRKGSSKRALK